MASIRDKIQFDVPFKLFANCKVVKGYKRSLIVDLGREAYYFIPNDLSNILLHYDGRKIHDIIKEFGSNNASTIKDYFDFLLNKEIIFFTKHPKSFPEIKFNSNSEVSPIYQAIIDLDEEFDLIDFDILSQLNELNCKFLELRIYKKINLERLSNILELMELGTISSVNIYIRFDSEKIEEGLISIVNKYQRVNNIFVFDAPFDRQLGFTRKNCSGNVFYISQDITNCKSCGVVSPKYFATNIKAVTEAVNHNSCLNRKISIDACGNIKNCPSMSESFGNIKTTTLLDALGLRNFKKYWNITKDKIEVCKDCEFRYICTDCRAYTEDPNCKTAKPLKCGYNPYEAKWDEWSTNPLKQDAIKHYDL